MIDNGTLYSHYSDVDAIPWPWPNFSAFELSSHGTGEYYHHVETVTALQECRDLLGKPLFINSAHRDWLHNLAVNGSPRSAHLFIAVDISLKNHDIYHLYNALVATGFTSFGFYETFIHADLRPGRKWFGSHQAQMQWAGVLALDNPDVHLDIQL